MQSIVIPNEEAMLAQGACLANCIRSPLVVYLQGDLGAGKTTFVRGFLQKLGVDGPCKSPTYTLVEPYTHKDSQIFHFDLYRLADPEELSFIGIEDYFHSNSVCLIEWPEKGQSFLPDADLTCYIDSSTTTRQLHWQAQSVAGREVLACLQNQ